MRGEGADAAANDLRHGVEAEIAPRQPACEGRDQRYCRVEVRS